jgi:hypothetical protein
VKDAARSAAEAVLVAAFTFAGTTAQAQSASVQSACMGDYQKLCSGTLPGGGRVAKCLVAHKDELTDGCKTALLAEAAKQKAAGK